MLRGERNFQKKLSFESTARGVLDVTSSFSANFTFCFDSMDVDINHGTSKTFHTKKVFCESFQFWFYIFQLQSTFSVELNKV